MLTQSLGGLDGYYIDNQQVPHFTIQSSSSSNLLIRPLGLLLLRKRRHAYHRQHHLLFKEEERNTHQSSDPYSRTTRETVSSQTPLRSEEAHV